MKCPMGPRPTTRWPARKPGDPPASLAERKARRLPYPVQTVMADRRLNGTTFILRTREASAFYEKLGFEAVSALRKLPTKSP